MDDPLFGECVTLHEQEIHYFRAGSGPVIVVVHGLLCSRAQWSTLVEQLSRDYTVVAPDLLGHGQSAKPRGDYSLGAHAATLRDLFDALDIRRATLIGHSFGGGIAMQFAYMFRERCARLVLVSSGGLGREVSILLRAPTLPGAEFALPLLSASWLRQGAESAGRFLSRIGVRSSPDIEEMWRGYVSLGDAHARRAFVATVRSVVDPGGQTVSALQKLAVLADLPVLLVWGARDRLIPSWHGVLAHQAWPGSRLEVFPRAGHFPHLDDPERFAALIRDFVPRSNPAARGEAVGATDPQSALEAS